MRRVAIGFGALERDRQRRRSRPGRRCCHFRRRGRLSTAISTVSAIVTAFVTISSQPCDRNDCANLLGGQHSRCAQQQKSE